jgi:nucleoside diphosphate kinase
MAKELAFTLINPYTISKSRTGGVIGRITSRTGLDMVAARMFGPSPELVEQYAHLILESPDIPAEERHLLADYVRHNYGPDPVTGRRRRVMMILFEGEDAVAKVRDAVGSLRPHAYSGETVRDTYGDYIVDEGGRVQYLEPAVMMGRSRETVAKALRLWASHSAKEGGIIGQATDVGHADHVQQTLVIIKPDNFQFPSARPGSIIDIFSRSGLRIVGAKVNRMTVAQAEEFYGPVRAVLHRKMQDVMAKRGGDALEREMGFHIPESVRKAVGEHLGPIFGDVQFNQIVEFMTGASPVGLTDGQKREPGLAPQPDPGLLGRKGGGEDPQDSRAHRSQQGGARLGAQGVRQGHHDQRRPRLRFAGNAQPRDAHSEARRGLASSRGSRSTTLDGSN